MENNDLTQGQNVQADNDQEPKIVQSKFCEWCKEDNDQKVEIVEPKLCGCCWVQSQSKHCLSCMVPKKRCRVDHQDKDPKVETVKPKKLCKSCIEDFDRKEKENENKKDDKPKKLCKSCKEEFDRKKKENENEKKEQENTTEEKRKKLFHALYTEDENELKTLLDDKEVVKFLNPSFSDKESQGDHKSQINSDSPDRHLPLTLAALKNNHTMIKNLLDKGANIRNKREYKKGDKSKDKRGDKSEDKRGDNVLHSLVRHAEKQCPKEITKITETFSYLLRQSVGYDGKSSQANNKSPQDKGESQQDNNESQQDNNESQQDNNESQQDNNKSQQDNNESQQDNNKSQQDNNKSQQDNNESQQDNNKSRQDNSESQQDNNKSQQDNNKSQQDNNESQQDKSIVPLWLEKNEDNLTVLSLATEKGVVEIVDLIIEKQNYIFDKEDKEFEHHDITNIDSVTNRISQKKTQGKNENKFKLWLRNRWKSETFSPSIFEILAYNEMGNKKAHAILQNKTINTVLTERWKNARYFIWGWMVIHFLYMIWITVYSSLYADAMKRNTQISIVFEILTSILAAPYLVISLLSFTLKFVGPRRRSYLCFNAMYTSLILIFGISTTIHFVSESGKLYFLIVSLITGWLFTTFFLSTIKYFSFFTVMLKRVFFWNLLSYSFVLTIHLISFTTVTYMMLKTGNDDYEFQNVVFMMFKLMVGLSEFEDAENTKSPVVSYIIYVAFVLLTYLVLMNALIAMMSETFVTLKYKFQLQQCRLEQLSALLFLEETLFLCFLGKIWEGTGKGSKYILKYRKYPVNEKQESGVPTDNNNMPHSRTEESSSYFGIPKYVLTDKTGQPFASIYVHKAQVPTARDIFNGASIIDVETYSPGLIIIDDPEKGRKLNITIGEQYFDDESIVQQEKKKKDEEKILNKTKDKNERRLPETQSSNDGEKSVTQKSSITHEGANNTPILDENSSSSAQK